MKQLLQIHSIPISIKCTINREPVERNGLSADVEVSGTHKDGYSIKSKAIQINIDSFEKEYSDNKNQQLNDTSQNKNELNKLSYNADANITKRGDIHVAYRPNSVNVGDSSQLTKQKKIDLEDLKVQYEMDKMSLDLKMGGGQFQFTPADVEFTIEQRAEVVIEYIGGPIYVPPSSDPDYEPEVDITV